MSLRISDHKYDGGVYVGAFIDPQADKKRVVIGAIAYVTKFLPNRLYQVTTVEPRLQNRLPRPLGIITDITYSAEDKQLLQIQTDGSITLHGILCDEPKIELSAGNLICWSSNGQLRVAADVKRCIGSILHAEGNTVRLQIIHE